MMNKALNCIGKYRPFPPIDLPDREWPNKSITKAPQWCSVDLRDGNQSIHNPMNIEQKLLFFKKLVEIGFKDIEIGFPSASQTDFDFARTLIDENHIPDDVAIQVLVQAREHLIEKTFEALKGAKNVIIHLYNSTSPAQRRDVFAKSKEEIIDIALSGVEMIKKHMVNFEGKVSLEYSPESFSLTEMDFALQISNAVIDAWNPEKSGKLILNLPATVECSTPNIYADQIEWICRNVNQREHVSISLHTHNDRGTAVAAAELGILAGADRVEGTLFGNGERTGNTDLLTVALNLFSQGVEPELLITDVDEICKIYEHCTEMPIHPRHPYVGELVYTAFSGSHQDAISKGLRLREQENRVLWDVPYLPIDPKDLGRDYEAIVKINSQSGKGGAAFVLEKSAGFSIPKMMQMEFSSFVQKEADTLQRELNNKEICDIFTKEFLNRADRIVLQDLVMHRDRSIAANEDEKISINAELIIDGESKHFSERGDGVIDALTRILNRAGFSCNVVSYDEHALGRGSNARAVAYMGIQTPLNENRTSYGAGTNTDISLASTKALLSAINRVYK